MIGRLLISVLLFFRSHALTISARNSIRLYFIIEIVFLYVAIVMFDMITVVWFLLLGMNGFCFDSIVFICV